MIGQTLAHDEFTDESWAGVGAPMLLAPGPVHLQDCSTEGISRTVELGHESNVP